MKRIVFLTLGIISMWSCKNFRLIPQNDLEGFENARQIELHLDNFYIHRIEESSSIYYDLPDSTSISEVPFRYYIQQEKADSTKKNIIEEAYLYLANFNSPTADSGTVLYFITKLIGRESMVQACFNNNSYISTHCIREIEHGQWFRRGNELYIGFGTESVNTKTYELKGKIRENRSGINLIYAKHPKLKSTASEGADHTDIRIKHIIDVDTAEGLVFIQNQDRKIIHPDTSLRSTKKLSGTDIININRKFLDQNFEYILFNKSGKRKEQLALVDTHKQQVSLYRRKLKTRK